MANPNPSYKFPKGNKANPTGTNRAKELAQLRKEDRMRAMLVEFYDKYLPDFLYELQNFDPNKCRNATAWQAKYKLIFDTLQFVTPKVSAQLNQHKFEPAKMTGDEILNTLVKLQQVVSDPPPEGEVRVIPIEKLGGE